MTTLADKTILVTGASQGLGEQVAKAYAAAGATVILVARHQKRLEKVYDAIVAAGSPEPFAICFDLMSAEEKNLNSSRKPLMKLPAENWIAWCIAPAISMLCRRWISKPYRNGSTNTASIPLRLWA